MTRITINQYASKTITEGIEVIAKPKLEVDYCNFEIEDGKPLKYCYSYRIKVTNNSNCGIRIRSRYWKIINSEGVEEELRGEGIKSIITPLLKVGESFEYSCFSSANTSFATMEGYFIAERTDGDIVQIKIDRFYLVYHE